MDSSLFSLNGKVALVTGASRGIGEATAKAFAKAGADIAIASRKLPDLEKVAEDIRGMGRKCLPVATHVGKMEEISNLVAAVVKEFGRIDILVNNAGTNPSMTPVIDADERLWDSIMNLNLKGLFFLSKEAAKIMREHGGGIIINVGSIDGIKPEWQNGIYSVSKAAVVMVTRVMAWELAQYNIRVNAIAPGNIHTRLRDSSFKYVEGQEQDYIKRTPMGRIGEPDDIVGAMIYLASDASRYVTGETIVVDGGFTIP
ncbi:MAG: glucose 1-dehydrogenase [Dehalococcoidales bacterium]|nr:glucose 1-dehydrogenase [Dehalococcoidales bacterium]